MRKSPALLLALVTAFVPASGIAASEPAPAEKAKRAVRVPLREEPSTPKAPPAKAAPTEAPSATAGATDDAKKAAPKKDAGKKKDAAKEDEIGKIDGVEIARSGSRYLGIQIVDGKFKLGFYDAKKKPVAPDVDRAALRWDPKYKLGMERVVLTPGGGPNFLTSEKFVRPPYNFKLTIVLIGGENAAEGEEPAGETHVIDFRQ